MALEPGYEDRPPTSSRLPVVGLYVVLVSGGLVVVVPRFVQMVEQPDLMFVAWIGGVLQALVLLLFGWLMLPKKRASAPSITLSILMGATFCAGAAILLVNAAAALDLERLVATPVIEEVVKLAAVAVVLLMLRAGLRGPLDGLVVGYFVAFGFTIVENMLYTYETASVAEAWQLVISRLFFQLGGHVLWTGIAGAALGYLIISGGRKWWLAVVAFAGVLVVHLLWDVLLLWINPIIYLGIVVLLSAAGIVAFILVRRGCAAFESRTDAENRQNA